MHFKQGSIFECTKLFISGDAYLIMSSLRDVKEALKYDRKTMGRRYLEVFEAR